MGASGFPKLPGSLLGDLWSSTTKRLRGQVGVPFWGLGVELASICQCGLGGRLYLVTRSPFFWTFAQVD